MRDSEGFGGESRKTDIRPDLLRLTGARAAATLRFKDIRKRRPRQDHGDCCNSGADAARPPGGRGRHRRSSPRGSATGSSPRRRCASSTATPRPGSPTSRRTRWCSRSRPKTCRRSCGCARRQRVPVIAFGTGTSLEGQVNAPRGGICLDFRDMNRVLAVHAEDLDLRHRARHHAQAAQRASARQGRVLPDRSRRRCLARRHGGDARVRHQCGALRHHEGQCAGAQSGDSPTAR